MLYFLDYFLTVFHICLVLFVLFGWIHPVTRKSHIILLVAVLLAWLAIGWYVGVLGYCPLTDWHWDVKRLLGERGMPSSFIEYIVEKLIGRDFSKKLIDVCTAAGLIFGVLMAAVMYWLRRLKNKRTLK